MKANVYSIEGKELKKVELPLQFETPVRSDLIKRAVLATQSASFQAKGTDVRAGLKTTARYVGRRRAYGQGINRGLARLPRIHNGPALGNVRIVPQSVGGRAAHPPKVTKILRERINKKERLYAIRSAIAATMRKDLVELRGHKVSKGTEFPIIVEDKIESVNNLKELSAILEKLGLSQDLERAQSRKIRAGRGKTRGRKYKTKKSALIVVANNGNVRKAASNIPGVEVIKVSQLNADILAPGTVPGRLVVWTEASIEELSKGLFGV
ncbi:MAG: 50S ribosomal protein L4 [Candidatus Diapherotrites archaeon]|nr:50S ribosomal protein L4 [Candidatus Diapherotrites archaeon]